MNPKGLMDRGLIWLSFVMFQAHFCVDQVICLGPMFFIEGLYKFYVGLFVKFNQKFISFTYMLSQLVTFIYGLLVYFTLSFNWLRVSIL